MLRILLAACVLLGGQFVSAQIEGELDDEKKDSIFIAQVENQKGSEKVLHAEPLYIDLIRDLGARKGEKEWNVGFGLIDKRRYDSHEMLVEYEWAPIDRLGLEVELPFTFYSPINGTSRDSLPSSRLNSLKLAAQWTFYVSTRQSLSLAIGYINELQLSGFRNFGNPMFTGNEYNPFFIAAKRWGNNFHTLLYTGPKIDQEFDKHHFSTAYEINTNIHYMISGTRNFIGFEFNKTIHKNDFDMTIRPQMRVGIADNLLIGIVAGIPIAREDQRLSTFVRLIWEPKHKVH